MIKRIDNGASYLFTEYSGTLENSGIKMSVHETCDMDVTLTSLRMVLVELALSMRFSNGVLVLSTAKELMFVGIGYSLKYSVTD